MNILIPDIWLRQFLKTDANPQDIRRCLSLCGPSVERIYGSPVQSVYDIETTTNRIDSYSVWGIAREAAVILPRFGFKAELIPPELDDRLNHKLPKLDIEISDHENLCRRVLAVKLANIKIGPSPESIQHLLEMVGQRPLNNMVDITNYVMWEIGHPIHVFDYDTFTTKKIMIRSAKKGETLITLDGKKHTLFGKEIVFDNSRGELVDLPSIMGTQNTQVTAKTKNVLLFIESSLPERIRYASMIHAIRTQAAVINEKGPDADTALMAFQRAIHLAKTTAGATESSQRLDLYPKPEKALTITVSHDLISKYIGSEISADDIKSILTSLGFTVTPEKKSHGAYFRVTPPSYRARDIAIPEDITEEVARIYGYHRILTQLPESAVGLSLPDKSLWLENELRIRLRDWGYTETYNYSFLSDADINALGLDKHKLYKITNPLSQDWVYLRNTLLTGLLRNISQNQNIQPDLAFFELSLVYLWRPKNLPREYPVLTVALTGDKFRQLKGLGEAILSLYTAGDNPQTGSADYGPDPGWYQPGKLIRFHKYMSVGLISTELNRKYDISQPVTVLDIDIAGLTDILDTRRKYQPVPKYPPSFEDIAFITAPHTQIGDMINQISKLDPLIKSVTLKDIYQNTKTLHIVYQGTDGNLTSEIIKPVRQKIIDLAESQFDARLKNLN